MNLSFKNIFNFINKYYLLKINKYLKIYKMFQNIYYFLINIKK